MAELMQAARRSSSSSCTSLLSSFSIESSEREELVLLFIFGPLVSPPVALSAGSDDPVEDPELPDLVVGMCHSSESCNKAI